MLLYILKSHFDSAIHFIPIIAHVTHKQSFQFNQTINSQYSIHVLNFKNIQLETQLHIFNREILLKSMEQLESFHTNIQTLKRLIFSLDLLEILEVPLEVLFLGG